MAAQNHTPGENGEFLRYFSLKHAALLSYRDDGTVHILRPGEHWALFATKKPEIGLSDWIERKKTYAGELPAWCRQVTELPSIDALVAWQVECTCETPTGHVVEPDGVGPDGAPSWLRALGLI